MAKETKKTNNKKKEAEIKNATKKEVKKIEQEK